MGFTVRISGITSAVLFTLALSACAGEEVDRSQVADNEKADEVVRWGHLYEPDHPVEACVMPAMEESLEGSSLAIETYPSGQLGSDTEMLEQVVAGSLDVTMAGPAALGIWYGPAAVASAGYLFEDLEHAEEVIDSGALDQVYDELNEESGLVVSSIWYYGTRHLTSNVPVHTPEDMEGLQVRVQDSQLMMDLVEAMGGRSAPMALTEVYTALQQGTLDGQENPIPTIDSNSLYEVQDYINLTGHLVDMVHITTSDAVIENFNDDQLAAWDAALEEGRLAMRECILENEEQTLDKWKQDGTINVNEDVDVDLFAERVASVMGQNDVFGEAYKKIREHGE